MNKSMLETFRYFFNKNEHGGSSRWMVTPQTVEHFINGIIKAFGGCTICYGKGYSTQMSWMSGSGDWDLGDGDVRIEKALDLFKPCECDRGAQFERIIRKLK